MSSNSVINKEDTFLKDLYEKNMALVEDYSLDFKLKCEEEASRPRISTGIDELDRIISGGLTNELYIIGSETSTGKSALVQFIGQNFAKSGIYVLYFILEMSRYEVFARGISLESYKANKIDKTKQLFSISDILAYKKESVFGSYKKVSYDLYADYANTYFDCINKHFIPIECDISGITAKQVAEFTEQFKADHPNERVVVIVDYLQILSPDKNDRSQVDRKTATDVKVRTLKALASHHQTPVIAISSVGRNSYGKKLDNSSFKESGDVEFTGGVLFAYNWTGVTDNNDASMVKTEKRISKERGYRKIALDLLKFRNGERDSAVNLRYFPAYSYFDFDNGKDI